MSLKEKARETLKIVDDGGFRNRSGKWIDISALVVNAVENSRLYRPEDVERLTAGERTCDAEPVIEVTPETTQIAASRLVRDGCDDLVLLNFASARNPGGGFINGAKAQEEDLARCSALYRCLLPHREYYDRNREQDSMLYTDHVIYSPRVPWFRVRSRDDPDEVFVTSVITAPAPNANQALRHGDTAQDIKSALSRRCGQVLGIARENGHRNLLLGAWGCGVFGNDPATVANTFKKWIYGTVFSDAFDRIVFAVYDRTKDRGTFRAFDGVFDATKPSAEQGVESDA